jgi:hypothetical protein
VFKNSARIAREAVVVGRASAIASTLSF